MQNNSRKETVTIPLVDYLSLLDDSLLLELLQGHGVDNWEGYGEAYRDYVAQLDPPEEQDKSCPYNCECGH
jgi:hypothetical protein